MIRIEESGVGVVKSIGIDIVEVERVRHNLDRFEQRFVDRILGRDEQRLMEGRADRIQFISGRFAAKEAVIKVLGAYLSSRPAYALIQIINDDSGSPQLSLPANLSAKLGGACCKLSITHERCYAAAVAIVVEEQ